MNPFDLPGPEFLVFFAACIEVLACALLILFHLSRQRAGPRIDPRDPYLVAYLRGGRLGRRVRACAHPRPPRPGR
jgi:hypothetical protein